MLMFDRNRFRRHRAGSAIMRVRAELATVSSTIVAPMPAGGYAERYDTANAAAGLPCVP
jgi:hypothetical protein